MLISLPDGLSVSGVTLWAVRLAGVLATRGHAVTLIVHEEPAGQARIDVQIPRGVTVLRPAGLPPLRAAAGDLLAFIEVYRDEVRRLSRLSGRPVVFLPTLLGDSFGIGAAIALTDPEIIRIVGFQHADTAYDTRLLTYYEPVLASLVGVSRRITQTIGAALPSRHEDIVHLANAVPVESSCPERSPIRGRPLRLVYTGRIEQRQKRVGALVLLSDELAARGVDHTLSLIGDGPARDEIAASVASQPARLQRIILRGVLGAADVYHELRSADCFVLASRYEGLSVAMIEAMAAGCVPVVTSVASGASEVVVDGLSGVLVEARDEHDQGVARAIATRIANLAGTDLERMSREAWLRVQESFSLESYAPKVASIIDDAAASPARAWPASRAAAFTSSASGANGSGSVPPDGARRLAAKLTELTGRRVVLHGAGRHTIELTAVLAASPARIVAITDDDPGRSGEVLLGWPIVTPSDAAEAGATDVIISSWLHADEIFARRQVYERQGLRVHHLYRDSETPAVDSYTSAACSN